MISDSLWFIRKLTKSSTRDATSSSACFTISSVIINWAISWMRDARKLMSPEYQSARGVAITFFYTNTGKDCLIYLRALLREQVAYKFLGFLLFRFRIVLGRISMGSESQ